MRNPREENAEVLLNALREKAHLVEHLADSNPKKKALQEALPTNIELVEALVRNRVDQDTLQSSVRYLLDCYINHQFLDVLIEQYEDKNTAFANPMSEEDRQGHLSALKTLQAKCTNILNQDFGKTIAPDKVVLLGLTKHKYYSNAYQFDKPYEAQRIAKEMCKFYRKEGQTPPLVFIVNSPSNDSNNRQSTEEIRKDIANNILTAASESGFRPDEIKIVIDNTPYPTSSSALGVSHFQAWAETADEKKRIFADQEHGNIRRPTI